MSFALRASAQTQNAKNVIDTMLFRCQQEVQDACNRHTPLLLSSDSSDSFCLVPRHIATCSGPARAAERSLPCGRRVGVVHASLHGSSTLRLCSLAVTLIITTEVRVLPPLFLQHGSCQRVSVLSFCAGCSGAAALFLPCGCAAWCVRHIQFGQGLTRIPLYEARSSGFLAHVPSQARNDRRNCWRGTRRSRPGVFLPLGVSIRNLQCASCRPGSLPGCACRTPPQVLGCLLFPPDLSEKWRDNWLMAP